MQADCEVQHDHPKHRSRTAAGTARFLRDTEVKLAAGVRRQIAALQAELGGGPAGPPAWRGDHVLVSDGFRLPVSWELGI